MKTVALKYCGGCDPAYDRVDYYQRIKEAAGDAVQWTRVDDQAHELVLVICGCLKACALDELPADEPMLVIKDDNTDPAKVAVTLLKDRGGA